MSPPASPDPAVPVSSSPTTRSQHRRAVMVLLLCTVLWSLAGVATRQLEHPEGFEMAFWRGLFCALAVMAALGWQHGGRWISVISDAGWPGLASGLMWAVMFGAFMVALTMAPVANVLVVMAAAPLLAALLGWVFLRERVPGRTWAAIAITACGIFWMAHEGLSGQGLAGMAVAFAVPMASAINIVLLKGTGAKVDLVPAVLIGAVICALAALPLALPLQSGARDLTVLAAMGVFQLALPCILLVRVAKHLAPHEIALLSTLEVVLGPLWAWIGAGEQPAAVTLQGGGLVLAALLLNELLGQRVRR